MARIPVKNSVRFEVFKRDAFICQYCGRKAPEVVLHCDHINPVAAGGSNDPMNLVTSCFECNNGKSDKRLDETHILNKQRAELDMLNERRLQLEAMIEWRDQLAALEGDTIGIIEEKVAEAFEGRVKVMASGRDKLRALVKKYGAELVLDATDGAIASYCQRDDAGHITIDSARRAFSMIGRVAGVLKRAQSNPELPRLFYICGILRNRFYDVDRDVTVRLLEEAVEFNADVDWLESYAKRVSSWRKFCRSLQTFIDGERSAQD